MFFKKLLGNKKIFLVLAVIFSSILMISPAFAAPGDYTPLVKIPGVNANAGLFDYLSGIYSFLISIVGIMAMAVLVYGGMRYITSAGNTASVQEAKESIESALAGLLLALVSWLIFATINKDILVLKNPGVGLPGGSYGYNKIKGCTIAPGSGTQDNPCKCADGLDVFSLTGVSGDCNKICGDKDLAFGGRYHCIKAVIVAVASNGLTHAEYKSKAREYKTADNPLVIPSGVRMAYDGVHYSTFNYPPPTACLDGWANPNLLNGSCDSIEQGDAGEGGPFRYDDYINKPYCFAIANPAAVQCRFHFWLTDGQSSSAVTGNNSTDSDLWIRILKP